MKYADITLYPLANSVVPKHVKVYDVVVYPRVNHAVSRLRQLEPTIIRCTLIIPDQAHYDALMALHQAHSENLLYVDNPFDKTDVNYRYYKQVLLEIGEPKNVDGLVLAPATFMALDPYVYDATTNEVVY